MADDDKKQIVTVGNAQVPVVRTEIVKRVREEPNEYELEDGSTIRVANPTIVVYRIEGQTDTEGNPAYYVKNGTSVTVVSARKLN